MPRKSKAPVDGDTSSGGQDAALKGEHPKHTTDPAPDKARAFPPSGFEATPLSKAWVAGRSSRESVKVEVVQLGSRPMVSIRVHRQARTGKDFPVPGRGFAISPVHVGELAAAIQAALGECIRLGLVETTARRS